MAVKIKEGNKILTELPRETCINSVCWKRTVGMDIDIFYENKTYLVSIEEYIKSKQTLLVRYLDKTHRICTNNFIQCKFGRLLGVMPYDGNFMYQIDEIINGLQITGRFKDHNVKYYNYKCPIDNNIDIITEFNLKNGQKCNVCCNQKILKGCNDIATTNPESITLFKDINDAYTHNIGSAQKVMMICPVCGNERLKQINVYFRTRSLGCICSDGVSYPEKIIYFMLKQTDVVFDFHKRFKWSQNKEYDFYIPSIKCATETNGMQHYTQSPRSGRALKEEQENDRLKERLAKENGVDNYITIDCRNSDLAFIKKNILDSYLAELIDLSNIDWKLCDISSYSSFVKIVADLWNNGNHSSVNIAETLKLSKTTIQKYLKRASSLKLCLYDPKEVRSNNGSNNVKLAAEKNKKKVLCVNNGVVFESITNAAKISLDVFKEKLSYCGISQTCNNKRNDYKGYKFKFI